MRSVGMSEPDGMLNGWNRTVRTTRAISRACRTTLMVSQRPPSSFLIFRSTLTFWSTRAWSIARSLAEATKPRQCWPSSPTRPARQCGRRSRHGAGLDHHEGLRERRVVGERDVDDRLMAGRHHALEPLERSAREAHGRPPAGQVDHLHVAPEDAGAQARAKGLGAGLLCGEAARVGGGRGRPALAAGPLARREDAVC